MRNKQPQIIDGTEQWECSTCHNWLGRESFYGDKRASNGLKNQCKRCHIEMAMTTRNPDRQRETNREVMRRARQRDPQKYRDAANAERMNPATRHKVLARKRVEDRVRKGKIVRPDTCSRCGAPGPLQAHHPDYARPLDVVWLCIPCHAKE